jgi:hypothetical protein
VVICVGPRIPKAQDRTVAANDIGRHPVFAVNQALEGRFAHATGILRTIPEQFFNSAGRRFMLTA